MHKGLDGIKKISKEEISKRREIILGMIGEGSENNKFTSSKKVDGIDVGEKKFTLLNIEQKINEAEKQHKEKEEKEWPQDSRPQLLLNVVNKFQKKESFTKEERKKNILPKRVKKEAVDQKKDKIKHVTPKKPDNQNVTKENKPETKNQEIKNKLLFKIRFRNSFLKAKTICWKFIFLAKKFFINFSLVTLAALFVGIIFYSWMIVFLSIFGPDNKFLKFIDRHFTIPVIIVHNQVIGVNDYLAINAKEKNQSTIQSEIIKKILVEYFLDKYKLNDVEKVNDYIVSDKEINTVAIMRINKIKKMINQGGDFTEVVNKYGEVVDRIDFELDSVEDFKYGEKIAALEPGEVSDIVSIKDGFYIFKCFEKTETKKALSYVYVGAKTFNEYLDYEINNTSYISFVD